MPDRREQIVVADAEALGIVDVARVQADAEQQPERVRPVVERREVVRASPPTCTRAGGRDRGRRRRPRPARRASRPFRSATDKRRAPPARAQLGLEEEPAVDVDDDLRRADEMHVEQREPLARRRSRARPRARTAASRRRSTRSRRAPSAAGVATACARRARRCGTRGRARARASTPSRGCRRSSSSRG